jgi:hypothetical protein
MFIMILQQPLCHVKKRINGGLHNVISNMYMGLKVIEIGSPVFL